MPRPKVKPQDRLRSVKACVPCKRSKIRCDAVQPCATCKRRSREDECIYEETLSRGRRGSRLDNSIASTDATATSMPIDIPLTNGLDTSTVDDSDPPMPKTESPQSRMLLSSKLHKVYIGETASLSYLQFLRQVLKSRVGSCAFTENEFNNYMLETDIISDGTESIENISLSDREVLVRCYKDATSGVLGLFTDDDMQNAIAQPYSPENAVSTAALYLVLAIGAQCRGTEPTDLTNSNSFFAKARVMAFESMLCDPGTDMVSIFLLMAFYMLGACHRNAAFMYLGVASRAASALGLHRADQYRDLAREECRARLDVWKSLRVLDTVVNSILGRSSGSTSTQNEEKRLHRLCVSVGRGHQSPRELALQAAFDICPFMDELERHGSNQSAPSAEKFLTRLQSWSKALPEDLRRWTDANSPTSKSGSRELYIGGTHVACAYYFAVMLTTRRFLTMHLLPKVRKSGKSPDMSSPTTKMNEQHGSTSLAHVCLNAAITLAKVGHNAMTSDRMMNNMCLMKAWMFAAGLLLGFHLFAHPSGTDPEAEEAFAQARAVEQKLALLSPQAGHYYGILTSFSDAIGLYQRRGTEERRRVASRFMDQIFTFEGNGASQDVPSTSTGPASLLGEDASVGMASLPSQAATTWGDSLQDYDIPLDPELEIGSADLPFTMDDLAFDWQPFAPFFDDLT